MAEQPRNGKVTVVGAGFYGSTTAQRLAEYDIFDTVVLTDIVEGKPEGLALVVAALLRLLLPERRAGFLAVRSRPVDVVLMAGAGTALTVIALTIPAT